MQQKNFIKAAILWALLPFLLFKFIKNNLVVVIISFLMLCYFFVVDFNCENHAAVKFSIFDFTAAFSTGINKSQQNKYIVIHHTASNGENRINDIAKIHLVQNRWSKIAYHYFIDNDNNVYQLLPESESAPHSYHRNNDAIAVCIAGNFSTREVPADKLAVLAELIKKIMKENNIPAENVLRHCDIPDNHTECCGKNFNIEHFRKEYLLL